MPSAIAASAAVEAKEVSPPTQSDDGAAKPAAAPATWKASIDFKWIRENRDLVEVNVKERQSNADVDRVVELYEDFVSKNLEVDRLRAERNRVANAMKAKLEADERERLVSEGKHLKDVLAGLEAELGEVASELQREGQRLPNLTHPDVPRGGEEVAATLRTVGEKRVFSFPHKDHVELGLALDLFDFDSAAEVSGAKFYYLRNEAALLEMALLNWALALLVARGFTPVSTPDLVRSHVVERCGFQPRAANTQVYSVEGSDLCLAGTAEIPVGGSFMDKILSESDLPQRVVAFSHCFRTEAGAAGSATRGLYRVHQFSKLEMFVVCRPEESDAFHQELIQIEEEMYTALGLHFVTLDMPTADLGAPAYRKFDIEAWMPGLNRYGEISSASNCTDYQARRLNIRYRPATNSGDEDASSTKPEKGKKKGGKAKAPLAPPRFAHTLNATACAVPRLIVSILENFQQEDGSVEIPVVLRPYMGGISIIRPR
ncbi:hypothetical protein CLOM_g17496 [Closterium sp. NIES-68]|nr:hypothetical protein CLOM_g17496 [Closterium sp. NIES-68]GJP86500.1 hypothetical protein CLOP_g16519 [Closterium sp. NIES-67]